MILKLAENKEELAQILEIQKENHFENLDRSLFGDKGFVTVRHDFDTISKMNASAPQVIAKQDHEVIGYALVMLREFEDLIPLLVPMFNTFDRITYRGKSLSDLNFYVMGQICVRDGYKRTGVFRRLYEKHREVYASSFDYCITEVSTSNVPSMMAHHKIGFKTIHSFTDVQDQWNILLWDWS